MILASNYEWRKNLDWYHNYVCVCAYLGFLQEELIRGLLQECAKMHKFNHPHVLKLMGVCLDGGPAPYIVMPFMANGSLLSYLRKERKKLVLQEDSEVEPGDMVSIKSPSVQF